MQTGLALKFFGLRPSLGSLEQAVHQFFSLTIPRSQGVCSALHASICVECREDLA